MRTGASAILSISMLLPALTMGFVKVQPHSRPFARQGKVVMAAREGLRDRESSLQDLGKSLLLGAAVALYRPSNAAATVAEISEPTPEFKATMAKMEALEKKEQEKKKAWKGLVTKLASSKTEDEIVTSLDGLTSFVRTEQGLPTGIKRQAVVTEIRSIKKAGKENKIWNKDAEISYEDLIRIINYMQSPNTSRDPEARVL